MSKDSEILKVNSPKAKVTGPYTVVFKDENEGERWAIVTLDWTREDGLKEACLGIRWFWGQGGSPNSHGKGTWFTIPDPLNKSILSGLKIDGAVRGRVEEFLDGKISGLQLAGRESPAVIA